MTPNTAPTETAEALRQRALRICARLRQDYPRVQSALNFGNPFELIIATILSAQCTDEKVNQVTPVLFGRYPDARALGAADPAEVEQIIHSTGFYRQKAKSIIACAAALAGRHGGQIPEAMEALTELPGVGRKTANLVRAFAMGLPGIIVDTHFKRVAGRLGLTAQTDPDRIEAEIAALLPAAEWTHFSNALIWHGRRLCGARKPNCAACPLRPECVFGRTQA
jgi:endonuclease-3